jgi:hypothetical protein
VKSEITAGLISSAIAIPLSMAFGMFALVSLGVTDRLTVLFCWCCQRRSVLLAPASTFQFY